MNAQASMMTAGGLFAEGIKSIDRAGANKAFGRRISLPRTRVAPAESASAALAVPVIEEMPGVECSFHYDLVGGTTRRCSRAAWSMADDRTCIFHSAANGRRPELARWVWNEARARAAQGNADYTGWHFPADPDSRWLTGMTFVGHTAFQGAVFAAGVSFAGVIFEQDVLFVGAVFQGQADFAGMVVKRNASFERATFAGEANFARAEFCGESSFSRATFQRQSSFQQCLFAFEANFEGCRFRGGTSFAGSEAGADLRFPKCVFGGMADFSMSMPEGSRLVIDLPSPEIPFWRALPFKRREQGATAYQLAARLALARGERHQAKLYDYAEKCAVEYGNRLRYSWKLLIMWWNPKWVFGFLHAFFDYVLRRLLFGFGDKPLRAAIATLTMVALSGYLCMEHADAIMEVTGLTVCPEQLMAAVNCNGLLQDAKGGGVAILNGNPVRVNRTFMVEIDGRQVKLRLAELSLSPPEIQVSHRARSYTLSYAKIEAAQRIP